MRLRLDDRGGIVVAALVGAALRLTYAWTRFGSGLAFDAFVYRTRAIFLIEGRSFISPEYLFHHGVEAQDAIQPPGASLWLALGHQLGFRTIDAMSVWSALGGSLTVVFVGLAARELAGPRAGWLAAAIAAVVPNLWAHDPLLMSESVTQLVTSVLLYLLCRYRSAPSLSRAGWVGAAAAALALCRSEMVLLIPVVVAVVVWWSPGAMRRRLVVGGATALWAALSVAPWVGWNLVRFEHPVTMASGFELTLSYSQCDDVWYGPRTGTSNTFCNVDLREDPKAALRDDSEMASEYRRRARKYVADHLGRLPVVVAARMGRTIGVWKPIEQSREDASERGRSFRVMVVSQGLTIVLLAGAATALVVSAPGSRAKLLPLLAPLAAGLVGAAVTFGTTRYRAAGEVGLVILTAVAIDLLWRRRRPSRAVEGSG